MPDYRISVTKTFTFHAAHVLKWHPGKCAQLHGHTYRVEAEVSGPLNQNGIVVDFDELESHLQESVFDRLDHTYLNELITNPTAEHIGIFIMDAASTAGHPLRSVRVWETADSSAYITT